MPTRRPVPRPLVESALVLAVAATMVFCLSAGGQEETPPSTNLPSGQRILDLVASQLPMDPLLISGRMVVRKQRGVVLKEVRFDMNLNWGAKPATATYTIRDMAGRSLEQLVVTRDGNGANKYTYSAGDPLAGVPVPNIHTPVQSTDATWADMTLAFLWWKNGVTVGTDSVKGFDCYLVDVPAQKAPDEVTHAALATSPYAKVRLWIEQKHCLMLQAEGYDTSDRAVRRLWVRSVKKINNRWMIKDMEIQGPSPVHRTKLVVDTVRDSTGKAWEEGSTETLEPAAPVAGEKKTESGK